jgi:murein DD-endopeptidase MepM/ murein hydrolase activator NlpD
MSWTVRQLVLLALLAGGGLAVVGSSASRSVPPEPAQAALAVHREPPAAGSSERLFQAAKVALDDAARVEVPFAFAADSADTAAAAFSFDARQGQVLEVTLEAPSASAGKVIYVELYRVIDVLGRGLHERLAALRPQESRLRAKLPSDGTYHVLVQSIEEAGEFGVKLELTAALPFPVVGAEGDAIRSLFGASRDAGLRHHQGVDIFVARLTPVLAVASGRAMPRQDPLGGNTVWLNTPGTSYYYAHLDRVAVKESQRVKAGDVLGYVGNTGNAGGMPAHLHFGVYRWGREPIDPLPLLVGQRFEEDPPAAQGADAGG